MLSQHFRPWGSASWLLPKLNIADWTAVGCISTEERSNAIFQHIQVGAGLREARFLDIDDLESDFLEQCRKLRAERLDEFQRLTNGGGTVAKFGLMDSPLLIKRFVDELLETGTKSIILDISTLPKRFFFPIVRLVLKAKQIENFVATYTVPSQYASGPLAFEPQDWSFLPLFQREQAPPTPKCVRVIVGVGFLPFHLPELVSHDYEDAEIDLILPFPPGSPQYQRNWHFVHDISSTASRITDRLIHRVEATDVSGCFDHLVSIAQGDPGATILAPFGPKPHSLAMCLYAAKHDCDVYYTQPRYYHPDYSTGIKICSDNKPATSCYAIRLRGQDLY